MTDAPTEGQAPEEEQQSSSFVFRDKRRVDPETGEVRPAVTDDAAGESAEEPAPAAAGADMDTDTIGESDDVAKLLAELAERTADLQRVQAEYKNYRRRVDRDREALKIETKGKVLEALLPVLDDVDRAKEHGELQGGFKAVADSLDKVMTGLGLERFGEEGDAFDPMVHEALTHDYSAEVDGQICTRIYQPGFRVNGRVVRVARVGVTETEGGAVPASVEGAIKLDDDAGADKPADGDDTTA